jgi:hypothetical protein
MGCKIVYPRELWVYADDSADLRFFMRQTEGGCAGHFQNSMKHFRCAAVRIKVRSTVRVLENLLTLLEGFFVFLATIMFPSNPVNLSVFVLGVIVVEAFVIYGALKLDRRDLLAQTPILPHEVRRLICVAQMSRQ